MKEIEKLEDLPMFMPIIYIKDTATNDEFMFGNNTHDSLVVSDDNKFLCYYNLQNGDGSIMGNYRFNHRPANCLDDEFYSRWVEVVDIKYLIAQHDKEIVEEVFNILQKCEENKKQMFDIGALEAIKKDILEQILEKIND